MADHPHTIDRWYDATGENLIEQIAAVGDYLVALETYRAAVKRWPKDKITLRNRARVIELAGVAGKCGISWRVNACIVRVALETGNGILGRLANPPCTSGTRGSCDCFLQDHSPP
jgi:hypothetical protein